MSAPYRNSITYNGRPISEALIHRKDGGIASYAYLVTDESQFKTPFPGPHTIDIALRENAVVITFAAQNDPTKSVEVPLPIRQWGPIISMRDHMVSEYERLMREGTRQEFDAQDHARREHHDASAWRLIDAAEPCGVKMTHEEARNLFAVAAALTKDVMPNRSGSIELQ